MIYYIVQLKKEMFKKLPHGHHLNKTAHHLSSKMVTEIMET